ncbi:MAG: arginine--tRNA ligase, partial [Acetobacteraceae bacterium]
MTDLFHLMRTRVLAALHDVLPDLPADTVARVEVTPARDPALGDMATNAALIAAKPAHQPPAKLAAALVNALNDDPELAEATATGPGFVNIRLKPQALHAVLPAILHAGESCGDSTVGAELAVNVEYVSTNPTGPLHIGHCRGAVVGDALANLLAKTGHTVTKEYYINDAGAQVTALSWATYWRYLQAIGTKLTEEQFSAAVPGGPQYRGDYLIPVGAKLADLHGTTLATQDRTIAPPDTWLPTVRDFAVEAMMRDIRNDLRALGVNHAAFSSERSLVESGAADALIERLRNQGLIYEGTLDPPKGKLPDDWEPRPQTLFRATQFGDDVDRPLRKSDGSNTYFANDIAYHADKVARGYKLLIDVLGADHAGYVRRLQAAVKAVSQGETVLEAVLCQIVH